MHGHVVNPVELQILACLLPKVLNRLKTVNQQDSRPDGGN
jgi:hypothetical protein